MLSAWAVWIAFKRGPAAAGKREKSMRLEGCIKLLLRVASNTSMAMVDLDAKYLQPACSFLSLFVAYKCKPASSSSLDPEPHGAVVVTHW
jgi:hypothetical protein